MQGLPTGTVTFLFTDLAGSTRLWEDFPDAMQPALARHDEIVRTAIEGHGGHVVKTTGDGFHAAFATAPGAAAAARAAQRGLAAEPWAATGPLRVRMGLHTGTGELRDGDYYGTSLNRAARIMAIAHGGQVVCSHATEELLHDQLTDGMGLVDLGEHGLRDLARPEQVFQLTAPGLDETFPPLRSLDAFPGNLPLQPTSFVGREEEIADIAALLDSARLVTLTGVGGVGKTRLALQVAAEVLPRFPDGAWVSELAVASDDDALVQVVTAALNALPLPGVTLDQSVIEFLRAKRLLLVLDNCEHLLDGAGRLADAILRECPGVRILATSREGLAVRGEQMMAVRSLGVPADGLDFDALAHSDAVVLFAERASAARAGFRLDAGNAAAVVEVCRRLDGIPLALELAAARVASMNPSDIAQRIDERFRLLTGGRRVGIERHQTLRATVDWSYSLLEPAEQQVFDRLSVFVGGFDATAAEQVVSGDGVEDWDVIDALGSLVLKSMVLIDETADGAARYQMLETLRAYGREQLDEREETDRWRHAHAAYFADLAEAIGPQLLGTDEFVWRRRLRIELDNLRAAVTWALDAESPADHQLAFRVITALGYEVTMDRGAGYGEWAERAMALLDTATPGQRCGLLGVAAFARLHAGDLDAGKTLAEAAIATGAVGESATPVTPFIALGAVAGAFGDVTGVVEVMDRADREIPVIRDFDRANLLSVRALYLANFGDQTAAVPVAEAAVTLSRRVGNPSQLAIALGAFGQAAHAEDPEAALGALQDSLDLVDQGASDVLTTVAFTGLADLRSRRGEDAAALVALRRALRHSLDVRDRPGLVGALPVAAEVLVRLGDLELAARCEAIPGAVGWGYLGGDALALHDAAVAPLTGLDPSLRRAAEEWAASASPEDLAVEIIAELGALIAAAAAAAAAGTDEEERPAARP